jgi:hypothetical protein
MEKKIRKLIRFLPDVAREGYALWVKPPRDYELRYERQREMPSKDGQSQILVLECVIRYSADGPWHPCRVAIDRTKKCLNERHTDSRLLVNEHEVTSANAILFFTFTTAAALSPLLAVLSRRYRIQEERHRMSRHGIALLQALNGQLDRDTHTLLADALRNSWVPSRRKMTYEEARQTLCSLTLLEESSVDPQGTPTRTLQWLNEDGACIGIGSFYGARDFYVDVSGTRFEGTNARKLTNCYRTKSTRHTDPKAA